ncbi:hypothetical protein COT97_04325 [Candidatus Falkowbacteria bacterium CG10_big_fil_rev_8_21_14_0_10_39_11]|uniref:Transposase IS200-like domain-containing protein n=1 Tax=Candidatus Falkowbacteria bacterium CG10_big_fil_rev_8_21_14_0_10_39_11 TaxID=1974565 RepID=A0A2H0V4B8_9BACT|nr:MAG: hypothetical protein COT97_04325 [Candidatus Falkowbacteria bacterium CG10_big_fil_rev_8_21_14_0_10_39_11]
MAVRYKIPFVPNNIYFITFTILGWKSVFVSDQSFSLVYKWFDYMKYNYANKVYGYVIMPNHIHLLLYISDKSPAISKLIQNAKRFFAYQLIPYLKTDNQGELIRYFSSQAKENNGAKHKVFEDRYDSKIVVSKYFFLEKLNYIHNNPLQKRWNLVKDPEDYKYSSAANYILGKGFYDIAIMLF